MHTQFAFTSNKQVLSITRKRLRILLSAFFCATVLTACVSSASAKDIADSKKVYQMVFSASLDPKSGQAHASVTLKQHRQLVRSIEFVMPKDRYLNIQSTSPVEINGERVMWRPFKTGDTLHFDFVIDHQRSNRKLDAQITDTWAILKLDHLFPTVTSRVVKGATSETSLILNAPKPWSIETPYGSGAGQVFVIDNPSRNFDAAAWMGHSGRIGRASRK